MDDKFHTRRFNRTEISHSTNASDLHVPESLTFSPVVVVTSCQAENVGNVREIVKNMRRLSLPNLLRYVEEPTTENAVEETSGIDLTQTGICYELDSDNTWTIASGNYPTDSRTYPQESETVGMTTKQKTKKRSWFSKSKRSKDDGSARKFGRNRSKSTREFSKSSVRGAKPGSRRRVSSQTEPKSSFNKLPGLLKKKGSKHDKNVPSTSSLSEMPEPETIKAALESWVEEAKNLNPPETTVTLAGNIPRRNTLPVRRSPHPQKKNHTHSGRKISAPAGHNHVSIDYNKLSRERRRSIESLISPNFRRRSLPEKMHGYSKADKEKMEQYRHLYSLISPRLGKKNWAVAPFPDVNSTSNFEETSSEESVFEKIREDLRSRKPSNPWIFNENILRNNRGSLKKKSIENNENPMLVLPNELKSSGEMLNIASPNSPKFSASKNEKFEREQENEMDSAQISPGMSTLMVLPISSPLSDVSLTASSSSSETLAVEKSKVYVPTKSGNSPLGKSPTESTFDEQKRKEDEMKAEISPTIKSPLDCKEDDVGVATSRKTIVTSTTDPIDIAEELSKTSISLRNFVPAQAQLNLLSRKTLASSSKLSTSDSTLSQYCPDSDCLSITSSEEACHGNIQRFTKPQDFIIYNMIKEELQSKLENKEFSRNESHKLCSELSDAIKSRIQEFKLEDFKITCAVFIGALRGTGVHLASRSVWNPTQDNFTTATFSNSSLFASATVLATKYQ